MSIILVSGGLDSATALAWALKNTTPPHIPVGFFYGQRHAKEQERAVALCGYFGLDLPRNINLAQAFQVIGGSSLTSGLVSGNPSTEGVERTASDLPPTFVPGRNLLMVAAAAALGYTEKVYEIVGGWNAVDYSGYPDCRPEFFESLTRTLNYALLGLSSLDVIDRRKTHLPFYTIHTPLISLTKDSIIDMGMELGVPYELTWSCYSGGDTPCGECDSCKIRAAGFEKLGIADPAVV